MVLSLPKSTLAQSSFLREGGGRPDSGDKMSDVALDWVVAVRSGPRESLVH